MSGVLYVVATPIGNLGDWSPRAIETLKTVAAIAAEDTRHSARLLQHFDIRTSVFALHDFNEEHRVESVLNRLRAGDSIALISDAGTPLISDPGYRLVAAAHQAAIKVVPVPGACAAIAALSAAGLASDRFVFEGFLPAKSGARQARLKELADDERTHIYYEAPHRIVDTLQDMLLVLGAERKITLAREITKTFETIRQGTLAEIVPWVQGDSDQQRGEFVLLLDGAEKKTDQTQLLIEADSVLTILLQELPVKQAAHLAAQITGQKKNALYERALLLKQSC